MSEINSIANGTFTIGQTSATNFQAGPGITITQPSEGTVRIANDETVLYEYTGAESYIITDTNFQMSESLFNFERVKVLCEHSFGVSKHMREYNECDVLADGFEFGPTMQCAADSNGQIMADQNSYSVVSSAPTTFTVKAAGGRLNINNAGTISRTNNRGITLRKIIGINRKEV